MRSCRGMTETSKSPVEKFKNFDKQKLFDKAIELTGNDPKKFDGKLFDALSEEFDPSAATIKNWLDKEESITWKVKKRTAKTEEPNEEVKEKPVKDISILSSISAVELATLTALMETRDTAKEEYNTAQAKVDTFLADL